MVFRWFEGGLGAETQILGLVVLFADSKHHCSFSSGQKQTQPMSLQQTVSH